MTSNTDDAAAKANQLSNDICFLRLLLRSHISSLGSVLCALDILKRSQHEGHPEILSMPIPRLNILDRTKGA
jgi:hypothetical protein